MINKRERERGREGEREREKQTETARDRERQRERERERPTLSRRICFKAPSVVKSAAAASKCTELDDMRVCVYSRSCHKEGGRERER